MMVYGVFSCSTTVSMFSSQHNNHNKTGNSSISIEKMSDQQKEPHSNLPTSVQSTILVTYRSVGLGLYGALIRYAGMPLEKIALYMNSSQVSGKNQLRQAIQLTFQDGAKRSFFTPYKVVGMASGVSWFLSYSVMGKFSFEDFCQQSLLSLVGSYTEGSSQS